MFPLYDNLNKELGEDLKPLTKSEKEKLINNIKQLDDNGHELIYTLIRVYYLNNEKDDYKLPYGMKSLKLGLRTDINQLPLPLQHIIKNFVELHLKSI